MKENFEIDFDYLTEEDKEKLLKIVEKAKPPIKKRWRGKKNDTYYSIASDGDLVDHIETETTYDNGCYQFGNYFRTVDEANFARNRQLVYQQLKDYALEHNTEKIDWSTSQQPKHYITFNINRQRIVVTFTYQEKDIEQVYFTSQEIAENAIKAIGENEIKHYLFGIDN